MKITKNYLRQLIRESLEEGKIDPFYIISRETNKIFRAPPEEREKLVRNLMATTNMSSRGIIDLINRQLQDPNISQDSLKKYQALKNVLKSFQPVEEA